MKNDWKQLIGKRVLAEKIWESGNIPVEVIVERVSSNGTYVKLRWPSGSEGWVRTSNWDIVEVLEGAADPSNEVPSRGSEAFRASTRLSPEDVKSLLRVAMAYEGVVGILMDLREFYQELEQEDVVRALESAIGQIPV